MRRMTWVYLIGLVAVTVPLEAWAQSLEPVRAPRNIFGIGGEYMQPTGEFHDFVSGGGGLNLNFVAGIGGAGPLGVRFDGNVLWYGHEHYDVWLGPRVPYSYARVSTDNFIVNFGIGPQITLGGGPIRPYGFGLAGVSYFVTESSVEDGWDDYYDSQTNFDDVRFALGAGGGFLVQFGPGRQPVMLDVGAQYTWNGETAYLREGSMIELPGGGLLINPIVSEANHWTFRAGVVWAF